MPSFKWHLITAAGSFTAGAIPPPLTKGVQRASTTRIEGSPGSPQKIRPYLWRVGWHSRSRGQGSVCLWHGASNRLG